MKFKDLMKKWENFANVDPLWAILAEEDKKGNKWKLEEFFEVGRSNAKEFVELAKHCKPELEFGSVLDFGCGVGRLTQGLAPYFSTAIGVDVSTKMIQLAEEYNRYEDVVEYRVNKKNHLHQFSSESFDMILSHIVLQHIPPIIHRNYILEFLRVLKKGGVCIFQLPEPFGEDWGSKSYSQKTKMKLDMYGTAKEDIKVLIAQNGSKILRIEEDGACGLEHKSYRYVFEKQFVSARTSRWW